MTGAWSPRGRYVWDAWFTRHQGALHVFYLQADRDACGPDPERRHDLASIGHAVATREGWREDAEPALAAATPGHWDDVALWTGSVVAAGPFAPFALFYTGRSHGDRAVATPSGLRRPERIGVAYSDDLREFRRSARSARAPVLQNPGTAGGFDGVSWRDPYVTRDARGRFSAFVCSRVTPEAATADAGGAIAYVEADGPEAWGEPCLLLASEDFCQLEVPQVFWRRFGNEQRAYLLFSAQERDCSAARRARQPASECRSGTYLVSSELLPLDFRGRPPLREPARLLIEGLYAGRLVDPETAERPLLFGFPWPADGQPFDGGLLGPRPVRFRTDGSIELRPVAEARWP